MTPRSAREPLASISSYEILIQTMVTTKEKRAQFQKLKSLPTLTTGRRLAEKKRLAKAPAVIERLKRWRKANKLSQRQAIAVMNARDFPISISALQKWEIGIYAPDVFAFRALEAFLDQHPIITDAPRFGRWKEPVPAETVADIRKLRESGMPLLAIGQRFGISESAVSRICTGNRRAIRRPGAS